MKLIAGLGNPGKNYVNTRHNVGFVVIDRIADNYNIDMSKIKHKGFFGEGNMKGEKVMLLKPQTFMNLSGESIREAIGFYKVSIEDLIVIYDDISLPIGSTRIRLKGSSGGHNGIKSIINHIGTEEFLRVKVGVGEKPVGWDLADWVLSKFSKDEETDIISGIEKAYIAVEAILFEGNQTAMNKTNQIKR